ENRGYDVTGHGGYVQPSGASRSVCVGLDALNGAGAPTETVFGDSISGHFTAGQTLNYAAAHVLSESAAITTGAPGSSSGTSARDAGNSGPPSTYGTTTTWSWASATPPGNTVTAKGTTYAVTGYSVSVTVTRAASATAGGPDKVGSFSATWTLTTSGGTITGT